jgi:hypothetical protein
MTTADHTIPSRVQRSGRWSGRVASQAAEPTENTCSGRISAPESFTRFSGSASPAERAPRAKAKPEPRAAASRLSRGQADRVARNLGDRDRAILDSLAAHRFLTTAQIERFHFEGHLSPEAAARICRRVLHRLHQLRVLEHLDRRVGGVRAGSASYVWRVGLIGDRLLQLGTADQPRARRKEPSLRHLEHCLAIADAHLALRDLAAAGTVELLQVQTEPACWRTAASFGSNILKPDLYAVTAAGDYEDHWFVEVDRATESLPTLLKKCAQYEAYRRTGSEQDRLGVFPLVVWVVPDQARADKLRHAIASSRNLDPDLYRVCTPTTFPALILGGDAA